MKFNPLGWFISGVKFWIGVPIIALGSLGFLLSILLFYFFAIVNYIGIAAYKNVEAADVWLEILDGIFPAKEKDEDEAN